MTYESPARLGLPVTLAELKSLGRFVRRQDIESRTSDRLAKQDLPAGYPLVASRLPTDGLIDLCVAGRWRQVMFVRMDGDGGTGDRRVVYLDGTREESRPYDWYAVAPAGHFTDWSGARPEGVAAATLNDRYELAQQGHVIHTQELESEDWPYLTFAVSSFDPRARFVEHMWRGSYTVHAADPRVDVDGVAPREPWFNTTIAVSHRWLRPDHPDPDDVQYRELLALCDDLALHDSQTFVIDYCSLPQRPRTPDEEGWFREHLPGFQSQFKYVTLVLNTGAADYATRGWCMLELMLAAMSRAPRPTLLNHDRLDEPLVEARDLALRYLEDSGFNQQQMVRSFGGAGLSHASFATWARDPMNVALYNSWVEGRRTISGLFEHELDVTDPRDIPIILDLLRRLAFDEAGDA